MKTKFMQWAVILTITALFTPKAHAFLWFNNKTKEKHEESAGRSYDQNALSIDNTVKGERAGQPVVSVTGTNNNVDVSVAGNPEYQSATKVGTEAKSNEEHESSESYFMKSKLPWSIALIMTAIGIAALVAAIQYARRTSPAIDAAIGAADRGFAAVITKVEDRLHMESDPVKQAHLATILSELNKQRGKVASHDPANP